VHFDFYRTPHKVNHVASLMTDLPRVARDVPHHIPRMLVVNWQASDITIGVISLSSSSSSSYNHHHHHYHHHLPPLPLPQGPSEPAKIFPVDDGAGFSCVLYFAITAETAEAFRDVERASSGHRLVSEFFKNCYDSEAWRMRLKAICVCNNLQVGGALGL
jgi:hypothetical protein